MASDRKGAPGRLFLCLSLGLSPLAVAQCPSPEPDESGLLVRHVHDGDTLQLEDGRRIRLIGIDTPELARKGKPDQPFARKARSRLWRWVDDADKRVALIYGSERHDRYQRTLAHVIADGQNLNARMLSAGLAVAHATPPNAGFSDCYLELETTARDTGTGFWQHPKYQPVERQDLMDAATGYRIVRTRIDEVKQRRSGIWLVALPLQIHIPKADLDHFTNTDLTALAGAEIEVRGWMRKDRYRPQTQRYLRLRHPSALSVTDD